MIAMEPPTKIPTVRNHVCLILLYGAALFPAVVQARQTNLTTHPTIHALLGSNVGESPEIILSNKITLEFNVDWLEEFLECLCDKESKTCKFTAATLGIGGASTKHYVTSTDKESGYDKSNKGDQGTAVYKCVYTQGTHIGTVKCTKTRASTELSLNTKGSCDFRCISLAWFRSSIKANNVRYEKFGMGSSLDSNGFCIQPTPKKDPYNTGNGDTDDKGGVDSDLGGNGGDNGDIDNGDKSKDNPGDSGGYSKGDIDNGDASKDNSSKDDPSDSGTRMDDPSDGGTSKDDPSDGGTSKDDPSDGGTSKDDPSDGGTSKDDPSDGGTSKDDPSDGVTRMDDPSDGGTSKDDPSDGGTSKDDPSDGVTRKDDPSDGGTSKDDPSDGVTRMDYPSDGGSKDNTGSGKEDTDKDDDDKDDSGNDNKDTNSKDNTTKVDTNKDDDNQYDNNKDDTSKIDQSSSDTDYHDDSSKNEKQDLDAGSRSQRKQQTSDKTVNKNHPDTGFLVLSIACGASVLVNIVCVVSLWCSRRSNSGDSQPHIKDRETSGVSNAIYLDPDRDTGLGIDRISASNIGMSDNQHDANPANTATLVGFVNNGFMGSPGDRVSSGNNQSSENEAPANFNKKPGRQVSPAVLYTRAGGKNSESREQIKFVDSSGSDGDAVYAVIKEIGCDAAVDRPGPDSSPQGHYQSPKFIPPSLSVDQPSEYSLCWAAGAANHSSEPANHSSTPANHSSKPAKNSNVYVDDDVLWGSDGARSGTGDSDVIPGFEGEEPQKEEQRSERRLEFVTTDRAQDLSSIDASVDDVYDDTCTYSEI